MSRMLSRHVYGFTMNTTDTRKDHFSPTREEFCQFCHLLYDRHLSAGVGGNVSARAGKSIWLTPSGYSMREIQPHNITVVDLQGRLIQGETPTKEANMHLGVLRARPDINVIFHLHGPYIISATTLLEPGPDTLPPLTPGFIYYAFPLTMLPFRIPGSPTLAEDVTRALSAGDRASAVFLQNHGLVTAGKDFPEALNIAEEIDEAARVYVLTGGTAPPLSVEDIDKIRSLRQD